MQEERWIRRRTITHKRAHGLRETVAEALARSERGYTKSAIARQMETSEGTVGSWHDQVAAEYGLPALHPLSKDQYADPPDLEPVTPEALAEQPPERQAEWANRAVHHLDHVPAVEPAQFVRAVVVTNGLGHLVGFEPEELQETESDGARAGR